LPPAEVENPRLGALGCHVSAILFRGEYPSTLKIRKNHRSGNGGVVVAGQPGIGKSIFLFYSICFSISLACGSPLPYNALNSSTFSLKKASKCITVKPPRGIFKLRGSFGPSQIPNQNQAADTHVHHFNGSVSRNTHSLSKRPLRQKSGIRNGERSLREDFS